MSDMPDKIWASSQRLNNVWGTKEYSETTEYTRTDLAQATIEKLVEAGEACLLGYDMNEQGEALAEIIAKLKGDRS